ncbi:Crp/Fnr family transcriptional regulator [Accumulibacter sp.]|uniref:Crp/Fnr family transcriptional regulator n=1 Tax=Accumulibacter sp. TaxID=2053492 RepID=UPI0025F90071|nr:Crp/Fnr family transcriptional regulator [Accumulibacter sp.]MCM8596371.1 Crp/Fnr family transcriptional regulator [Accumulibacter sp.]MCM8624840.1 Crp/Fnr family transcriptional regulator [Accumulibacter sp.]MDS4050520.1 Crp/Fnr family transcriptional regulator [Accumulibacter sp.]
MQTLDDLLNASRWAKQLTAEELNQIRRDIVVRTIPAGGYLCMKGEAVEYWTGIIDGLTKMTSHWPTGKATSFVGLSSGSWFGEGSLLKDEPRRYDVIALRETRIACMKRSRFHELLDHSIPFNRFVLMQLNERLSQFIGMVEHERLLDPDARLARCIASMFNPLLYPDSGIELHISQEEIGLLAGISRQRVNRSLARLAEAGLLRVGYGTLTVLDVVGLRSFGD